MLTEKPFMFNPRPSSFQELDHAKEANELLENLSENKDIPHLLFHGPEGSGKYTRALLFLQNIYGDGVTKIEESKVTIEIKGKEKEINVRSSPFHVELIPTDNNESDKVVIQEYVKKLSTFKTLTSLLKKPTQLSFAKTEPKDKNNSKIKQETTKFRVVMIFDADNLTNDAQQSLRRTMETGSEVCRFMLFCTNPCNIIQPIRSRCVMVRVPCPSKDEMVGIVQKLPGHDVKIAGLSRGNILLAEAIAFENYMTGTIENLFWKQKLALICTELTKSKEIKQKLTQRKDEIVDLLTVISPEMIIRTMFCILMESSISMDLKMKIPPIAMKHSHEMALGSESIYHIEAFLLEISSLLNPNN